MSDNAKKFTSCEEIENNHETPEVHIISRIYIPETEELRRMERDRIIYFES